MSSKKSPGKKSIGCAAAVLTGWALTVTPALAQESPLALEMKMRQWLNARFSRSYVKVLTVGRNAVDVVVTVVPTPGDPKVYTHKDANRLAGELREALLPPGYDFRNGSQFSILAPGQIRVTGAGPEFQGVLDKITHAVMEEVTSQGLALKHFSAAGFRGPQISMQIHARGIDLGPQGQLAAQNRLDTAIRERVMNRQFPSVAYLEGQSGVDVADAARPVDAHLQPEENPGGPWYKTSPSAISPVTLASTSSDKVGHSWDPPSEGHIVVSEVEVSPDPPRAFPPPAKEVPAGWAPTGTGLPPTRPGNRPLMGATPKQLVPPSRAVLAPAPRRRVEPGALARRLRELRARRPWVPAMPPSRAAENMDAAPSREPLRIYPASPFGIGPGVSSCELFVRFDTDKHTIKSEENANLSGFLEHVPPEHIRGIVIRGHADSRYTTPYNLALGHRRAEAVKDWLVAAGVKEVRIETQSAGESEKMATNRTDYGRSLNRRALLQVTFAEENRAMHSDRSPHWRSGRSMPSGLRRNADGSKKPLDPHWPQHYSPKVGGE